MGSTTSTQELSAYQPPEVTAIPDPPSGRGRVVVVMPAYNASKTLVKTIADIPQEWAEHIVLVDDCSKDDTADKARHIGVEVIRHETNTGYGGNQKTCYRRALELDADIVVMIHPDYQYDARVLPAVVTLLELGTCDVILGSRIRSRREALDGGMPLWKYVANRLLTITENVALGQNLGDFHSGFRAYRREVLKSVPYESNSDDFVFDSQFLAQSVFYGFKLGDVPIEVRYFEEASSINFRRSCRYGLTTLWTLVRFWAARFGVYRGQLFARRPPQT